MFRTRLGSALFLVAIGASAVRADDPPPPPPAEEQAPPPAEEAPPPPPAEAPPADAPPKPEPGFVTGRALDGSSKEGLPAASIQISGGPDGDQMIATELDGTFKLTLAPGTYKLVFSTPDYIEQTRTVTVTSGKEQKLADVVLPMIPQKAKEETIEVYDTIDTHKSSAVLAERRASATVSDAISSEQISRSPDSNGADAAKRMVAATIQ